MSDNIVRIEMSANTTEVVCDNKKCKYLINRLWACKLKTITLRNGTCSNAEYEEERIEHQSNK